MLRRRSRIRKKASTANYHERRKCLYTRDFSLYSRWATCLLARYSDRISYLNLTSVPVSVYFCHFPVALFPKATKIGNTLPNPASIMKQGKERHSRINSKKKFGLTSRDRDAARNEVTDVYLASAPLWRRRV